MGGTISNRTLCRVWLAIRGPPGEGFGGGGWVDDDNNNILSNFVGLQRMQIGAVETTRSSALGVDLGLRHRHV